jgi:NADPH:quinone reductase
LDQGRVLVSVYAEFALQDVAKAHALMESRQHIGKIVLRVKERPVGSTATSGWA